METLLALNAAAAEPSRPTSPAKDLGLQDADAFPCLVDADGWQITSQQLLRACQRPALHRSKLLGHVRRSDILSKVWPVYSRSHRPRQSTSCDSDLVSNALKTVSAFVSIDLL